MRKQNAAVKEKLPSSFRPFLLMHMGYLVFFNLPSIFINTFFLSIVDDVRFTYMYNIILYLIQGIMMIAGAYALRKIPSRYCTRIGILLSSVGYLLLLLLREQSVRVMPLLALVMGAGGAFYWISFAMLLTDSSSDSSRDKAYSSIALVGAVVTLIIPFTSGNIIRSFTDSTGYFAAFDDTGLTSELRPEMFAIKEVILGAGRIAGIFILYFLPPTFFWCAIELIILTGFQYITGALCHLSVTARKREKELQQ